MSVDDRRDVLFNEGFGVSIRSLIHKIQRGGVRKVVVMCGAGISVSAGIPDFRTPGTGLYSQLQSYNLPQPEAIFDIDFFRANPHAFNRLAKELFPGNFKPTLTHYFIRMLHEKGLLLRCYTQNIDDLETLAGIPPEKIVNAHGSFSGASCTAQHTNYERCTAKYPLRDYYDDIMAGRTPTCKAKIPARLKSYKPVQPGDSSREEPDAAGLVTCGGYVKPNIVFFRENLPESFYEAQQNDFQPGACDLLIVMGTSLQIFPFAGLIARPHHLTPRLLLNRDARAVQPRYDGGPSQAYKRRRLQFMKTGELNEDTQSEPGQEEDEVAQDVAEWKAKHGCGAPHFTTSYQNRGRIALKRGPLRVEIAKREEVVYSLKRRLRVEELDGPTRAAIEEELLVLYTDLETLGQQLDELDEELDQFKCRDEDGDTVSSAPSGEGHDHGGLVDANQAFHFWHRTNYRDLAMLDDCDKSVEYIAEKLGWLKELSHIQREHNELLTSSSQSLWDMLFAREEGKPFMAPKIPKLEPNPDVRKAALAWIDDEHKFTGPQKNEKEDLRLVKDGPPLKLPLQ